MKTFGGAVRGVFVLGSLVVVSLLVGLGSPVAGASPAAASAPQAASVPSWQQAMKHLEVPSTGCFTSSFPTIQWEKSCARTGRTRFHRKEPVPALGRSGVRARRLLDQWATTPTTSRR